MTTRKWWCLPWNNMSSEWWSCVVGFFCFLGNFWHLLLSASFPFLGMKRNTHFFLGYSGLKQSGTWDKTGVRITEALLCACIFSPGPTNTSGSADAIIKKKTKPKDWLLLNLTPQQCTDTPAFLCQLDLHTKEHNLSLPLLLLYFVYALQWSVQLLKQNVLA